MEYSKSVVSHRKMGQRRLQKMLALALVLMTCLCWNHMTLAETGKVTATGLIVRAEPSTEGEGLKSVKKGGKLEILEELDGWYKVKTGEVIGYVASQFVSVGASSSSEKSSGKADGKTIASLGEPPKTSKPGDNNNHVKKLQEALTIAGYYDGRISGNYGELTEKAVKAFQKAKGISQTGSAGSKTIKALFGKTNSAVETEKLDWYKDHVSKLIPKDAIFTVKDVRSGRTFEARRWSGGDHIDAEPYKKSDTETMKKCYGGNWSWDRRPVLIQFNGHVYAASMNGMPHGSDDTIANNDFEGVFCIHFAGSKTHGSDKVDSDHQAAVKEAAKAEWDD